MKIPLGAMIMSVALTTIVFAQAPASPPAGSEPAAAAPSTPASPAATPGAAAVPVPSTKRYACQSAAQAVQGQDRRDQIQLCIAEARVDCLKQAIDKKIVGPERRDFIKNCIE